MASNKMLNKHSTVEIGVLFLFEYGFVLINIQFSESSDFISAEQKLSFWTVHYMFRTIRCTKT